jgi:putative transposase
MKNIEYIPLGYESDLTDSQWEIAKDIFGENGNKSKYNKRTLVEAVLYIEKTGCQWRLLPHDFPPYSTVWSFYRRCVISGKWARLLKLLVKITRKNAGRSEEPTYALIDSQSVKTVAASQNRGYDGGKKRKA